MRAALVLAALSLCASCVQTVSLGSGLGEEEPPSNDIPIKPWLPSDDPVWADLDGDALDCQPALDTDLDGDGFTPMEGDCNDCDPDIGPNAVEMLTDDGAPADENCDGNVDEVLAPCDVDLTVDADNPYAAARALDLCAQARDDLWGKERWGVQSAAWVLPDGSDQPRAPEFALGHGILERFGPNVPPRRGGRMLALSSGTARQPTDPDYEPPRGFTKGFACRSPDGFPQSSTWCPSVTPGEPRDGIALELTLRVPQNAAALAFDFDFYTYELPGRFCTAYDDLFVALLQPPPEGQPDGNIAFDNVGDLVSVNNVLLEACQCTGGPPCAIGGRLHACTLGNTPLIGTGFSHDETHEGDKGATGWLTSTGAVERGGTVTLRFAIHDAGDGFADSTVLLDNFRWLRRAPLVPKSQQGD